jgi:glycosidase
MNFITNHDENSWSGTEYERMGTYVQNFAVITYLMPGIPLIYTGQEAGLNKRLLFFEKDTVSWNDTSLFSFYRKLNTLKHNTPALRAGINAGKIHFQADTLAQTVSIMRTSGENCVIGFFNFSNQPVILQPAMLEKKTKFRNVFTDEIRKIKKTSQLSIKPWEFILLEKQ